MKSKNPYQLVLIALVFILSGCVSIEELTPTPLPTNTPQPTAVVTAIPTIELTPQQPYDDPQNKITYTLSASMDYDAKTITADETIDLINGTGIELRDLQLVVLPNSIPSVFELVQLNLDGKEHTDYVLDGQSLLVKGVKLPNGEKLQVQLRFKLVLPTATQGDPNVVRPAIFGVSDKQVNITDWYPMVVPYTKDGWLLHPASFYGEHLVYSAADVSLDLTFTDPTAIPMIAASSLVIGPEGTHKYQLTNARDLVLSMGRQMHVTSGEVKGVTVNSYYFEPYAKAGEAVLSTTLESVDLFSHLFGPLQGHNSISAVQGDFDDGMEFDGLYYLSNSFYNLYDGNASQYLVMVAAHETCHQWWFGQVANDQSTAAWLDESLSTYCEKLYYENFHPDLVDWWWMTRINFYEPKGLIDGDVSSYGGFEPYTNAVYRQGAKFMDELRTLVGDEAFFGTLRQYADEKRFKIATPQDFFRILREHTDADLTPLIKKYFSGNY